MRAVPLSAQEWKSNNADEMLPSNPSQPALNIHANCDFFNFSSQRVNWKFPRSYHKYMLLTLANISENINEQKNKWNSKNVHNVKENMFSFHPQFTVCKIQCVNRNVWFAFKSDNIFIKIKNPHHTWIKVISHRRKVFIKESEVHLFFLFVSFHPIQKVAWVSVEAWVGWAVWICASSLDCSHFISLNDSPEDDSPDDCITANPGSGPLLQGRNSSWFLWYSS